MTKGNYKFDDETIQELFGVDDAENENPERLKAFFFKNKAYENLKNNLPVRVVVGHKGIGKSALLKICYLEDRDDKKPAVFLKPDQIGNIDSKKDFNGIISDWKIELRRLIISKFYDSEDDKFMHKTKNIATNIISDIFNLRNEEFKSTKSELFSNLERRKEISVYIDDLDRGWKATTDDVIKISALLNAIRDLSGDNPKLRFIIALRTDVYQLVRTSDESTDKIEQNIINLTWTNYEILFVLAKRIDTFFNPGNVTATVNMKQPRLFTYFDPVIVNKFTGVGKWENAPMYRILLSLTRERPRDLIKLLSNGAKQAHKMGRNKITTEDLQNIFNSYSQERLQDLINEFKSELPKINDLLFEMRPVKKERTALEAFSFDKGQLISKIKSIQQHHTFHFKNMPPQTKPQELAEFLYRIDFITARNDKEGAKIQRIYYKDNKNLMATDFGFKWEIHPAYRWALQPTDLATVFQTIDLQKE